MANTTYRGRVTSDRSVQATKLPVIYSFPTRIIVAGTRGYDNKEQFKEVMREYLKTIEVLNQTYCFISGAARSGADRLVIDLIRKPFVCYEYPASWDKFGKRAGYIRNSQMAKVATHLICFWDGRSKGSRHMITEALAHSLTVHVFRYDMNEPKLISINTIEDL